MRAPYGARRLVAALGRGALVVLVVAVSSVTLMHLAPGDPLGSAIEGQNVPPEVRARWCLQQGCDRPLPLKIGHWLWSAAHGDLGFSFSAGRPVSDAVRQALPYTLLLAGVALTLGFALGIALAFVQARRPGGPVDRWLGDGALALWALPEFVLALVLIELFSLRAGWLPSGGPGDLTLGPGAPMGVVLVDRLRHLVLPATTLAIVVAAQVARMQRVSLSDVWRQPFIRAARAKGVGEGALLQRHCWRAALGPTVVLAGLALPTLAGGAFIVERVFAWPGMGSLAFQALADRDPHLALGCVVLGALLVVVGGAIADLVRTRLDPRPEA